MTNSFWAKSRGVSLIEAMVALAVMAFGMLGVVGMQSTLRFNGDIAKQRSEAVRMIQAVTEQRRNFSTIAPIPLLVGRNAFDGIVSQADSTVAGTNATFTMTESVVVADTEALPMKTLLVGASWRDRTDQTQSARATTIISRSSPEVSAALVAPAGGGAAQGRKSNIPPGATDLGNGTSQLTLPPPPGPPSPVVTWIFDNASGFITKICVGASCTGGLNLRLLAGVVSFATMASQPTAANAAHPSSTAIPLGITINVTDPLTSPVACITGIPSPFQFVQYFCAVPVNASSKWSGYPTFSGIAMAIDDSSASAGQYRVCRYTPNASGATASQADHPAVYTDVTDSLSNQNFLVIAAGDGVTPFTCPGDDSTSPGNTNTFAYYLP